MAGRAARWAAARCEWSRACLMVYGGRAARPTGSSAAQGASMRSALHVRLLRGWRVCFRAMRDARMCSRCGRGRARRAARSHRGPTPVGLLRDEGGRAERPCRHRVAAKGKESRTWPGLRNHGAGWGRTVERLRNGGVAPDPVFLMPETDCTRNTLHGRRSRSCAGSRIHAPPPRSQTPRHTWGRTQVRSPRYARSACDDTRWRAVDRGRLKGATILAQAV